MRDFSSPCWKPPRTNPYRIGAIANAVEVHASGNIYVAAIRKIRTRRVTIFLNGLGVSNPAQNTGALSPSLMAITPAATINGREYQLPSGSAVNFLSTATLPGSIDSIAQVQIQVTSASPALNVPLEVQQVSEAPFLVRGPGILIWVRPN